MRRAAIVAPVRSGVGSFGGSLRPVAVEVLGATVVQAVLERARLVRRRVVGRTHLCRAEPAPLAEARDWIEEYRRAWEANFERLDRILDELKSQEKPPEMRH